MNTQIEQSKQLSTIQRPESLYGKPLDDYGEKPKPQPEPEVVRIQEPTKNKFIKHIPNQGSKPLPKPIKRAPIVPVPVTPRASTKPKLLFLNDESRYNAYQEAIQEYLFRNQSNFHKAIYYPSKAIMATMPYLPFPFRTRREKILDVVGYKEGFVVGSSVFSNVMIASQDIARLRDISNKSLANLRVGNYQRLNHYIGFLGLVLKTDGDDYKKNDYLAKNLFEQVQKRTGRKPTPDEPALISLRGLSLMKNENSYYGFRFMIGDETEILFDPEFSHDNHNRKFSEMDFNGVPIFDDSGDMTFYSRSTGLASLIYEEPYYCVGPVSGKIDCSEKDLSLVLYDDKFSKYPRIPIIK